MEKQVRTKIGIGSECQIKKKMTGRSASGNVRVDSIGPTLPQNNYKLLTNYKDNGEQPKAELNGS